MYIVVYVKYLLSFWSLKFWYLIRPQYFSTEFVMSFPSQQHLTQVATALLQELSVSHVMPLGEDLRKLAPSFFQTSPHVSFLLANFALYSFMLNSVSLPKESLNLEVILGNLDTISYWMYILTALDLG